jgi:predicted transcriptional regulator
MAKTAKQKDRKDRLSISLSAEEKETLEQIARKNQISIARVVRQAITNFLQNTERQRFLFKSPSDDSAR